MYEVQFYAMSRTGERTRVSRMVKADTESEASELASPGNRPLTVDGVVYDEWVVEDIIPHVDYPHEPGTLYDCPACEEPGELDAN